MKLDKNQQKQLINAIYMNDFSEKLSDGIETITGW